MRARGGQAIVLVSLALVVLCGMVALSVDVGMSTSKQHMLRDARQLLVHHNSVVTTTNTMVWNSLTYHSYARLKPTTSSGSRKRNSGRRDSRVVD